jgi:hypothetical protein
MLGNPPWEHIELKEIEFFAQRSPEIAKAANAAARKRAIEELPSTNPLLMAEYEEAKRQADGETHLIRASGSYPLCARGRINVYTIFAELIRNRLSARGLMGVVLPSGIATDDTTKFFFQAVINTGSLVSLLDFENKGIFVGVHSSYKFCIFTCGSGRGVPAGRKPGQPADFVFFAHSVEETREPQRRFGLTAEEIAMLKPNTMTCPTFRTRGDAELTKHIHRRVPVLVREKTELNDEVNTWGVRFRQGLFNMASDSNLFRTRTELEAEGWVLVGNIFRRGEEAMLPLYEAKLFHQFDHRYASYGDDATVLEVADLTDDAKEDSARVIVPRYWVPQAEVDNRLRVMMEERESNYCAVLRGITRGTDYRTTIAAISPDHGFGDTTAVVRTKDGWSR